MTTKTATFCNICGIHTTEGLALFPLFDGMQPKVAVRNFDKARPNDVIFCSDCENDTYVILADNHKKRRIAERVKCYR